MISEAHFWKFGMFTWSLGDWCADYYNGIWGHTQLWMSLHLFPCIKNNCPRNKFYADSESSAMQINVLRWLMN